MRRKRCRARVGAKLQNVQVSPYDAYQEEMVVNCGQSRIGTARMKEQ
jgi:hypothetical protein